MYTRDQFHFKASTPIEINEENETTIKLDQNKRTSSTNTNTSTDIELCHVITKFMHKYHNNKGTIFDIMTLILSNVQNDHRYVDEMSESTIIHKTTITNKWRSHTYTTYKNDDIQLYERLGKKTTFEGKRIMEKTDLKLRGEGCVWGWGLGGVGRLSGNFRGFPENQNHRVFQYNTIKSGFVRTAHPEKWSWAETPTATVP